MACGQDSLRSIISDSVQIIDFVNNSKRINSGAHYSISNTLLPAIENQSFATIRSGGPSVLSTVLHRGMASRHIAVLWGGFNIQSVVNGTYDLSLIRNTFDNVKFYSGSTTSATGNASIAGAISLDNGNKRASFTAFKLSTTSAKNFGATVTNKFIKGIYHHHLTLNRTSDKNEYDYKNGNLKLTQMMAKFSMWSLNYEGHFLVSEKLSFTAGSWFQSADRNIPPTKTSAAILQEQKDANFRGYIHATYYPSEDTKIKVRTAYFDELLEYQAPGIFSLAESKIFNGAIDLIHESGLSISGQFRNDRVEASFFEPMHGRNTYSILANYNSKILKDTRVGISLRPEWVDGKRQPLSMSVSMQKEFSKDVTTTVKYNKGYALPSFNDLYWPTGGNPDLKTERSQEIELGLRYKYGNDGSKSIDFSVYMNLIDDWIQWTPVEGFFQPVNQRKVRNLGMEFKIEESLQIDEHNSLRFVMLYGFTDSRIAKQYLNQENEGKRTIFVPVHKINGQLSWKRLSWQFLLQPIYYSKRYDTADNSSHVPGFLVADVEVVKSFKVKNSEIHLSLAAENAFNNDYENIRFFPMPLRVFTLGLNIKL